MSLCNHSAGIVGLLLGVIGLLAFLLTVAWAHYREPIVLDPNAKPHDRRWKSIGTWENQCRVCGDIEHGYSYGGPDTAIYFDFRCSCNKRWEEKNRA